MVMGKFFLAGVFAALMSICSLGQAHVLDGAKEWNDADSFCKSMGGHLATAETQAENEVPKSLVLKTANGREKNYRIGGYSTKQSIWKWVTGKTISD